MHVVECLKFVAAIICFLWARVNVDFLLVNQLLLYPLKILKILHCIMVCACNPKVNAAMLRLIDISLKHISKVHLDSGFFIVPEPILLARVRKYVIFVVCVQYLAIFEKLLLELILVELVWHGWLGECAVEVLVAELNLCY